MKQDNEKQAIEEMARIICRGKDCKSCVHSFELRKCGAQEYAERLYNADYRKQSVGEWINLRIPKNLFACSNCEGRLMGHETNFCPHCGAKMKGGE